MVNRNRTLENNLKIIVSIFFIFYTHFIYALQERHLVIIRHGEGEQEVLQAYNSDPLHPNHKPSYLTDKGRQQIKIAAEQLLTHGFDNRNIAAVYVSPLQAAKETAEIFVDIGVFTQDKIHVDKRLIEMQAGDREGMFIRHFKQDPWFVGNQEAASYHGESNEKVRRRMLALYDEVEMKHPEGHILFITHGLPSRELLDELVKSKVQLQAAQLYIVPLNHRQA